MELEMKFVRDDSTKICGWCFYLLLSYVKAYNVKSTGKKIKIHYFK